MTALTQSELYQNLRPAQRIAALSALKAAIDGQIIDEKASLLAIAAAMGVKSFTTEFGAVNIVEKEAPLLINEFALFDFVKENSPEVIETIEKVPDWYVAQLSDPKNMVIVDGVVYNADGLDLPYVTIGEVPPSYVSWPASKEQKAGKAQAADFVRGNVGGLSADVLGLEVPAEKGEVLAAPVAAMPVMLTGAATDLAVAAAF